MRVGQYFNVLLHQFLQRILSLTMLAKMFATFDVSALNHDNLTLCCDGLTRLKGHPLDQASNRQEDILGMMMI